MTIGSITAPMRRARGARLRMAVIGQGHFAQAAVLPAIEQLDELTDRDAVLAVLSLLTMLLLERRRG